MIQISQQILNSQCVIYILYSLRFNSFSCTETIYEKINLPQYPQVTLLSHSSHSLSHSHLHLQYHQQATSPAAWHKHTPHLCTNISHINYIFKLLKRGFSWRLTATQKNDVKFNIILCHTDLGKKASGSSSISRPSMEPTHRKKNINNLSVRSNWNPKYKLLLVKYPNLYVYLITKFKKIVMDDYIEVDKFSNTILLW